MLYPVNNDTRILKVQKIKNAVYLFSLGKGRGYPADIYFQRNHREDLGYSPYFALYNDIFTKELYIADGKPYLDQEFAAIADKDSCYISNYCHGFYETPYGIIDGGPEYCRTSAVSPPPGVKVGMIKLRPDLMLKFIEENGKIEDLTSRYKGLDVRDWFKERDL